MSGFEELNRRVAALEERVSMESGLRASVDRDLADITQTLRAQKLSIQALAVTQSHHTVKLGQLSIVLDRHTETLDRHTMTLNQHTETLDQHTEKLDRHTEKLDRHTETLDRHGASLTAAHGKLDQIVGMLDRLVKGEGGR
jgi:chromosome segregation ATPase